MSASRRISAEVPVELYDRLSQAAQRSDRSMSWVVDQALQSYLDEDEARHCATLAALADVDAGRSITDAAMDAWLAETTGATEEPSLWDGRSG